MKSKTQTKTLFNQWNHKRTQRIIARSPKTIAMPQYLLCTFPVEDSHSSSYCTRREKIITVWIIELKIINCYFSSPFFSNDYFTFANNWAHLITWNCNENVLIRVSHETAVLLAFVWVKLIISGAMCPILASLLIETIGKV